MLSERGQKGQCPHLATTVTANARKFVFVETMTALGCGDQVRIAALTMF